jgi:hypothetical protein
MHLLGATTIQKDPSLCRLCSRRSPRGETRRGFVVLGEILGTYPGPPDRPSDAWRLVAAGSPLPRVGRHRTAASVPGTGSPAGAAFRVGPGDLELYE